MRLPEYYLTHHGEIDLSNCNNIPDAPRVAGHNSSDETVTKKEAGKREGRSAAPGPISAVAGKKSRSKSKKTKTGEKGPTSDAVKVDKALYTLTGKNISTEQVTRSA
jgi:hypothetical protein